MQALAGACLLPSGLLLPDSVSAGDKGGSARYPFILIHGAWGSGQGWWKVKPLLEAAGHKVYAPDLPGLGTRGAEGGPDIDLSAHIADVARLIEREHLAQVILVGHSLGGMVVSGVADKMPDRIAEVIYIDAFLPENGESAMDLLGAPTAAAFRKKALEQGNGWAIPSSNGKGPPQPIGTLEEKIRLTNPKAAAIPGSYILTMEPGANSDAFVRDARRAQARIWPVSVLRTGHLPQVTMPQELVALLEQAALAREP